MIHPTLMTSNAYKKFITMLNGADVAKHNSINSCFVVIHGQAYDVTEFLDEHPGGARSILRYGGKDATAEYEPIHPKGTIERFLPPGKCLGPVDMSTLPASKTRDVSIPPKDLQEQYPKPEASATPISTCMNMLDIEHEAHRVLSKKASIYYSSAADDLSSLRKNAEDWTRITFRPRVLRNVARVDMRRMLLGRRSELPFFIAPAALAKLGHPDGELCIIRGAAKKRIPYCVSTASSVSVEEMAECGRVSGTDLFFQLYVAKQKGKAQALIRRVKALGYKGLVLTVDTPVVGKREEDERYAAELEIREDVSDVERTSPVDIDGEAPILRGINSSTLNWDDLKWIREEWANSGPFVLKGIQCAEDAKLAAEAGIRYIYLSNHGGRQISSGPSSISTLLEIRRFCPEVLETCEIYLDGGVRRGSDMLKALCLGATGVAVGRPFMYALSAYGTAGVVRAIQILSDEIETTMRLLGVTSLSQLHPAMVNATKLEKYLPHSLPKLSDPLSRL